MVRVAHECGAGLVKFQLFNAEDDRGKPHYEWVKAHELTFDQAKELFDFGASIGQEVFFSVFIPKYVAWCEKIGVKRYKVASGVNDAALLTAIIRSSKNRIVSSDWDRVIVQYGADNLLCPPGYPTPLTHIQMPYFKIGECPFEGFSDHTIGIDAAKIALARGARIIEKHFVLDHCPEFPDDAWSMTPDELRELVRWEAVCQKML